MCIISSNHQSASFNSDEPSLDEWLKKSALKNHVASASRCFVIGNNKKEVIGYYCLYAGAINRASAPKTKQRNMPDPLPVLTLGRLAIDEKYHNKGLGSALLRDAMIRAVNIATDVGVLAILIHSLSSCYEPATANHGCCLPWLAC